MIMPTPKSDNFMTKMTESVLNQRKSHAEMTAKMSVI